MRFRVEAGTDIAMIGAWDAMRDAVPLPRPTAEQLEAEAAEGSLLLIHTGADGGGPIDLYIEEEMPSGLRKTVRPLGNEVFLALPTGQMHVAGVEAYRSGKANGSPIVLPKGDYCVRCFAGPDEDFAESEAEIRKAVGADNVRYYDRVNTIGLGLGCATPVVLFPILAYFIGWKIALPAAAAAFLGFFHLMQWTLKRNPHYKELEKAITGRRLASEPTTFILELNRIEQRGDLRGGSIRM